MQIILVLAAMWIAVPANAKFSYKGLADEIGWNAEMLFKYGKDNDTWGHCPLWNTQTGEKIKIQFLGFSGDNPWQPIDLYLDAYEFTQDEKFLDWAINSAKFIWEHQINKETIIFCQYDVEKNVLVSETNNGGLGQLELIRGYLRLHEITRDKVWLRRAERIWDGFFDYCVNKETYLPRQQVSGTGRAITQRWEVRYYPHIFIALGKLYQTTNDKKYHDQMKGFANGIWKLRDLNTNLTRDIFLATGEFSEREAPGHGDWVSAYNMLDLVGGLAQAYQYTKDRQFLERAKVYANSTIKYAWKENKLYSSFRTDGTPIRRDAEHRVQGLMVLYSITKDPTYYEITKGNVDWACWRLGVAKQEGGRLSGLVADCIPIVSEGFRYLENEKYQDCLLDFYQFVREKYKDKCGYADIWERKSDLITGHTNVSQCFSGAGVILKR